MTHKKKPKVYNFYEDEEERDLRLKLSDKAPEAFKIFDLDELEILHDLISLMPAANRFNKSTYVGNKVSMRVKAKEMSSLANKLGILLDTHEGKRKDPEDPENELLVLSWEMEDRAQLFAFLSMFDSIKVPLDFAWITDQEKSKFRVRVDNFKNKKYKYMRSVEEEDLTKYKAFLKKHGIELPVKQLCSINIGNETKAGNYYTFKIIFTMDQKNSGTLRFSYSLSKFCNGVADDLIAEGDHSLEVPQLPDNPLSAQIKEVMAKAKAEADRLLYLKCIE